MNIPTLAACEQAPGRLHGVCKPKRVKFSLGTGICYAGLSLQRTFRYLTAGGVLLRVTQDSLARLANANLAAITQQKSRTNNMRRGRIHCGPTWKNTSLFERCFFHGDPYGNRTHVTAVKGPCLNRLTNGPMMVADVGFEPTTCRVWTGRSNQLS